MPCREFLDRSAVDEDGGRGDAALDLVGRQIGERRDKVVPGRPEAIQFGKPSEVGRKRSESIEQLPDEPVLVGDPEQGVGTSLRPEAAGPVGRPGGRTERPGSMGRVEQDRVGEVVEAVQSMEHLMSEWFGEVRSAQIRSTHCADHERSAGEQYFRNPVIGQEVRMMVRGVARRRYRDQFDPGGEFEMLTVDDRSIRRRQV